MDDDKNYTMDTTPADEMVDDISDSTTGKYIPDVDGSRFKRILDRIGGPLLSLLLLLFPVWVFGYFIIGMGLGSNAGPGLTDYLFIWSYLLGYIIPTIYLMYIKVFKNFKASWTKASKFLRLMLGFFLFILITSGLGYILGSLWLLSSTTVVWGVVIFSLILTIIIFRFIHKKVSE